jgi:histidine triad (HIT) family protein
LDGGRFIPGKGTRPGRFAKPRVLRDDGPDHGRESAMDEDCVFCAIAAGRAPASLVHEDAATLAFVDLRQWHAGHTLVIPRRHLHDVRELDPATGAALMDTVARVARAVSACFPNRGLSLWHSIGEAAQQEVPHLHIHVHPRLPDDPLLAIYPAAPPTPPRDTLDDYARRLRLQLDRDPG